MSTNRPLQTYDSLASNSNYEYVTSSTPNGKSKVSLEDFVYELKQRNEEMSHEIGGIHLRDLGLYLNGGAENHDSSHTNGSSSYDSQHLLTQLAKKEKDIILAAELGKALLDRNEELTRTNEQINEEYTRNLELLEQEKYALRKKLNSIEIEYENKIHELQSDLNGVRDKLGLHLEIGKQNEAENSRIIGELTEQNQRLTNELTKSSNRESLLEKEIQSLKEQFHARRTNFSDHIGQLEGLRNEINLLSRRKLDLEGKISALSEEKDSISISLDESQYRILEMEKHLHEKDMALQTQQKDLDELRRMNTQYQNRLDYYLKLRSFDSHKMQGSSLYNEIEMSSHSSGDDLNPPNYFSEEDIDSSPDNLCFQCSKQKHELFDLFNKLKNLYEDLYRRRVSDANTNHLNVSSSSNHDSGIQTNLTCMDEVNELICDIQELIKNIDLTQCITCQEFIAERGELERMRKENQTFKDQVQKLSNEVVQLSSSNTILETELNALKEVNQVLKGDIDDMTNLSKDEIVRRAWKVRDDTIARKKTVEIELAKVRIELMHVNSQLLETIQQKVELSQQLEQWQVDMEQLIEEQLKNKLSLQEKARAQAAIENMPKKENLFDRIRLPKLLR